MMLNKKQFIHHRNYYNNDNGYINNDNNGYINNDNNGYINNDNNGNSHSYFSYGFSNELENVWHL